MKTVFLLIGAVIATGLPVSCSDDLAPMKELIPPRYDQLKRWSDGETDVFMFVQTPEESSKHQVRLILSSPADIKVFYRSNWNSGEHSSRELEQADQIGSTIKAFDFSKEFTRSSVWFALDFKKDGRIVEALANSFYDGFEKKYR